MTEAYLETCQACLNDLLYENSWRLLTVLKAVFKLHQRRLNGF